MTALATIAMVVVALLQWQTLEKTDTTLRVVQRPWISIEKVTSLDPWPRYEDDKVGFTLLFFLKNVGHSPALDIRVDARVIPEEPGRPVEWTEPQRQVCASVRAALDRREKSDRYTIVPNEVFPYRLERKIRKPTTDYSPVIVGCIVYRTARDITSHQTPFFARMFVDDPRRRVDLRVDMAPIKISDLKPPKNQQLYVNVEGAGDAD
ncbi:MAG: hypothetical protein ACREKF_15645 [Candidatus Methylomirabilales bacterium]